MIPFNKAYSTGKELQYIKQVIESGKTCGDGDFTQRCHTFFQNRYGFNKCLLTTSCMDALEMAALLIDIKTGDEVIMPSYTFVSTAVAFVRAGAVIRFVDSRSDYPGIDENEIESHITPRTKAIVVVHYAGVACDMDKIMDLAGKYHLWVVEDAAHAIDSFYKGKPLGGIGHLGCFSFHETKNIQCGEGGMLVVNHKDFEERADKIWEKGTNRAEFLRGGVNRYDWVDIGSSFLPSEISAAFLFAQLEELENIQEKRIHLWQAYYDGLTALRASEVVKLPFIPAFATNNAHMFYVICNNLLQRNNIINCLKDKGIHSAFHYQSLHKSPYYIEKSKDRNLVHADFYSDCLLRLPLFPGLSEGDCHVICTSLSEVL